MNDNYILQKTQDGTFSLYSSEYEQAMHSVSGAYEEARLKHVFPCGMLTLNGNVTVLDIGFGLGYNVLAAIDEFLKKNTAKNDSITVISLEKEKNLSDFLNEIFFNDARDLIYKDIKTAYTTGEIVTQKYSIKVIFGDARESVKNFKDMYFDAVFHDPYSPAKNPELWTVDFFKLIYNLMKENAVLTTYSSAVQARKAMLDAGLVIGIGPSVGNKREGTIAGKGGIESLSDSEIQSIINNIKSAPYRDENLSLTKQEILDNRKIEMQLLREKSIIP